MTPERWQQINELFHSALEQERGRRAAFLAQACAGDEDLRQEVGSLVASHERGESFIEAPASDVAAELLASGQTKLAAGQNIAHYRITTLLGEGGMGEVYLAEDARLGRRIALKLLPAQFTRDAERVRRFEQEARSASALNHPNIITIHEIGQTDSLHFIATEFIDGETLRQHMAGKRAKLDEVLDIATQVASALAAAHEAGIVHRDIKPENIVLRSRDQIVKVLDFGLAKLALQSLPAVDTQEPTKTIVKTNPGLVLGTVQYMSPEQARGQEVDARTDIWSLGVVLYEMVAGRAPFEGETPSHLIVSIMEREPPPLSRYAQVPAELERIVTKTLRKNREERYQTAADLALDLKSLKQEQEVEARLKRASQWDSDGKDTTTESGAQVAVETVHEFAASTVNVATARSTSSAEYLIGEIKQHGRVVTLTVAAVLVAVAALAYFYRTSGGEGINSVAVLPFVDASGNPNTEYLSEGISDAVINSLSRLPKLRVISLNAVLRYKGKQIEPQAVGRELNVRAVLIGRMTQRGDSLAISTELVDVSDNRRLWGEQYSRKLSDILAVQDEIAREITERLRLQLSNEDKKHLAKHYTEDTEAYRLYILGKYELRRAEGKEGFEQSIKYFEQAIRIDPNYALAYGGLQTHRSTGDGGSGRHDDD